MAPGAASLVPLSRREVHLWDIDTAQAPGTWSDALSWLDYQRASSLQAARAKDQFLRGRAAMRSVLTRYVGAAPRNLTFYREAEGKPRLVQDPAVSFSFSRQGTKVCVAVARAREVGVDVETLARAEAFPTRVLHPEERAWIESVAPAARPEALMRIWTLKEASLKCAGTGFTRDPASVSVARLAASMRCDGSAPADTGPWGAFSLLQPSGHVVSLVAASRTSMTVVQMTGAS